MHGGTQALRQDAREVGFDPSPGHVRRRMDLRCARSCEYGGRMDPARRQQRVAERPFQARRTHVERQMTVEDDLANQRVTVRVKAARSKADDHIAVAYVLRAE